MSRRAVFALVLAASGLGEANGRHEAAVTINFRQGHDQDIAAGMTFGLLLSHDGGATWHWMCESAVLYQGTHDPDYAYTASGALFATTRDDMLVMRDGCTFAKVPNLPPTDVSSVALGSDGSLHMAAVEVAFNAAPGDARIYRSTDDGTSFPGSAAAGLVGDWYSSLEIAPGDATRLYLAAFRNTAAGRAWQLYRSTDGGASYQPMSMTGFGVLSEDSSISFVGIGRTTADTVFALVSEVAPDRPSSLYRSTNGGASWVKVRDAAEKLAFVLRANSDAVVAAQNMGAFVSHDLGETWIPLAGAPHINCLAETTAGEVWACTENYGTDKPPFTPSDGAGIMKTTNLATWTPVLRFEDVAGPVECAVGTRQHDQCVYDCTEKIYSQDPANCPNTTPSYWSAFKVQLGITTDILPCPSLVDLPPLDAPPKPGDPGCHCNSPGGSPPALLAGLVLAGVLGRRRRR